MKLELTKANPQLTMYSAVFGRFQWTLAVVRYLSYARADTDKPKSEN